MNWPQARGPTLLTFVHNISYVVGFLRGRALAFADVVNPFLSAHLWQIMEIVEFWNLAAGAGWDEEGLKIVYIKGLNGHIKDELATHDPPSVPGYSHRLIGYWTLAGTCQVHASHFPLGPLPGSHPPAFAHSCL